MYDDSKPDIRDYESDLWEMEERQRSYRNFQRIFQIYAVFGALIGVLALAYFFIRRLEIQLSLHDQLILMTAGIGFTMSIFSILFLFLRQQRYTAELERSRYMGAAADFLLQWTRLESLGRERLEAEGRDFNRMSIRNITAELLKSKVISADEFTQLEEVLRFRNLLVHSGSRVDPEVLAKMTEILRLVIKHIEI